MKLGDSFCVGCKDLVWFKVREVEGVDFDDIGESLGGEIDEIGSLGGESESLGGGDVTDVDVDDPVKEFGFVVMGHEFDNYPKRMIQDIRNWDCEEDAELIKKLKIDPKPKYKTRSKDQKKNRKGASTSRSGTDTTKIDDEEVGEGINKDRFYFVVWLYVTTNMYTYTRLMRGS
ncbi:hypothetical protein CTI12_AA259480 [Artemisia annua]|uniref:Uncharacterized protein n=1 Tax=Artemisia annua TaxID=35608 RepID=A0A2U1NJH2_ARTAN|nr:hypothetical protein CTI12_AA259480 [Artemisia annua]